MKDFSTILLIKILRATVDHVQQSPEIDQASPDVRELKRTLLEQIMRLQGSDLKLVKVTTDKISEGAQWISPIRP